MVDKLFKIKALAAGPDAC